MKNKDYSNFDELKATIGDLRPLSLIENIESELGNHGLFTRGDRDRFQIIDEDSTVVYETSTKEPEFTTDGLRKPGILIPG